MSSSKTRSKFGGGAADGGFGFTSASAASGISTLASGSSADDELGICSVQACTNLATGVRSGFGEAPDDGTEAGFGGSEDDGTEAGFGGFGATDAGFEKSYAKKASKSCCRRSQASSVFRRFGADAGADAVADAGADAVADVVAVADADSVANAVAVGILKPGGARTLGGPTA